MVVPDSTNRSTLLSEQQLTESLNISNLIDWDAGGENSDDGDYALIDIFVNDNEEM